MDTNGDGRVDFPEFVEYFVRGSGNGSGGGGGSSGGGGGHLIELLRLLLNPAALVSSEESASAQIFGKLLPLPVTPPAAAPTPVPAPGAFGAPFGIGTAFGGPFGAPPLSAAKATTAPAAPLPINGRKMAMSSMMVTAAANDPLFLKRVGLADRECLLAGFQRGLILNVFKSSNHPSKSPTLVLT
jgi:hypothetical protein